MNITDLLIPPKETPAPEKKHSELESIFLFLDSITHTKQHLMPTEREEKLYRDIRYTVLRVLSFYADLVPYVNLVNQMRMSPRMEYEFLLNVVPARVRRDKWIKKNPKSLYLRSVQEYYGYNETRAEAAMKLLSVEQLEIIDKITMKRDDICEGTTTISHTPT